MAATPQQLIAQLNRFADPSAPAAYRLFDQPLPLTQPIDWAVSQRVAAVLKKRLDEPGVVGTDPRLQSYAGTFGLLFQDASGALVTSQLDYFTSMIATYADLHGLPTGSIPGRVLGIPIPVILGVLVTLGAGAFAWNRYRRRLRS